jgi:hypothetical protein
VSRRRFGNLIPIVLLQYLVLISNFDQCIVLGIDVSVFNATIPTSSGPIQRASSKETRAQALAKTGKTSKAGPMWYNLKGMMLNGEELLRAREIQRENWEQEQQAKEEREMAEFEEAYDAACNVYDKFFDECDREIKKLNNPDLKALIKYIVPLEGREDKTRPSSYTTNAAMIKRLNDCVKPWWKYFQYPTDDEESDAQEDDNSDSSE